MKVAFVLRSAEVQPLFRDLCRKNSCTSPLPLLLHKTCYLPLLHLNVLSAQRTWHSAHPPVFIQQLTIEDSIEEIYRLGPHAGPYLASS